MTPLSVLAGAYLIAILLPLALTVAAVGLRVARRTDVTSTVPAAEALRMVAPEIEPPRVMRRSDEPAPGALHVAGSGLASTKVCPDCAETILHSARVCRHCHYRFAPPLVGSAAVL